MPRDIEFNALGRARLKALADRLREPMPEGFAFDFQEILMKTKCGTVGCAMGLAVTAFDIPDGVIEYQAHIAVNEPAIQDYFGLSDEVFDELFYGSSGKNYTERYPGLSVQSITPAIVADAIDAYLAESA